MPLNANHMVTLTALRYDGEQDKDTEQVCSLSNVGWYGQMAASPGTDGLTPGSLYKIRIFAGSLSGYVPYAVWQGMNAADRAEHWSIAPGDKLIHEGTTATVTLIRDNRSVRANPHLYLEAR